MIIIISVKFILSDNKLTSFGWSLSFFMCMYKYINPKQNKDKTKQNRITTINRNKTKTDKHAVIYIIYS